MRVFVSICNYNAAYKMRQSIDSILLQQANDVLIGVVDNASKDDSRELLEGPLNEDVDCLLLNDVNVGKAIAMNTLVKTAIDKFNLQDDDLIFSLDSDIKLNALNFFTNMKEIWTILSKHVSCLVCTQSGNNLSKRQFEWTDSKKSFHYFVPKEGYGYGIAGGAVITSIANWKLINGYRENMGKDKKQAALYGGMDGWLLYDLFTSTHKPICVIKELEVFHFDEENKEYQKWKNQVHLEHQKFGFSKTTKGFFD